MASSNCDIIWIDYVKGNIIKMVNKNYDNISETIQKTTDSIFNNDNNITILHEFLSFLVHSGLPLWPALRVIII